MPELDDALCRQIPIEIVDEMFFSTEQGRYRKLELQAIRICTRCPVRIPCLEMALEHEQDERYLHGIFGGYTARQRARFVRDLRRAK